MNKVLVIMAVFNGEAWLEEQLDSILSQTGVDIELLVGDDCSSDRSVEILTKRGISAGKLISFREPSGSAGRNFLRIFRDVDLGESQYVAFSDQDDVWNRDKIARGVAMLEKENADLYSCAVTARWPSGKTGILTQSDAQTDLDFLFEGAGQGCTFVLRTDFALTVQRLIRSQPTLFAGVHYHDWPIYAICRALRKRWIFDPDPSMTYRQHGLNDTGARWAFAGVRKRVSLMKNGWYRAQISGVVQIVRALNSVQLPTDFLKIWYAPSGVLRRLALARVLLRRGRRRRVDRVVLSVVALMGWL